ncbi:uncharacterized protein DS421_5g165390 [Arachis hypogaea]|nr:uncharacterized protein DS421_5g165390 [Arachis hypogaea]
MKPTARRCKEYGMGRARGRREQGSWRLGGGGYTDGRRQSSTDGRGSGSTDGRGSGSTDGRGSGSTERRQWLEKSS